ncbi:putative aminopeptidase [Spathaspora sp. JA1]|nr:putative aminopeptidase [Spathaspora sp. JA1]
MKLLLLFGLYLCLVNSLSLPFAKDSVALFKDNKGKDRLIKLGPNDYRIVTEEEKLDLKAKNIKFIDITNQVPVDVAVEQGLILKPSPVSFLRSLFLSGAKQINVLKKPVPTYKYPEIVKANKSILGLYEKIDTDLMFEKLSKFTSFYTRYYKSESGLESADWLYQQILDIIEPIKNEVNITKVDHVEWDQYSIIVSIPGKGTTDKVIVGAHQDSTNLLFPNLMKAPGADDDGSGTVTILESFRILVEAYVAKKFVPYNTLEFHWYSAEEGGLLGSIDVFSKYASQDEVVVGMLQQDMTGYTAGTISAGVEPHFGLITDYTSVGLNEFLKSVINVYNSIPYHESSCGYACSDHASALENGYPSAFLIESEMKYTNKYIHSVMDTVDRLDWDHIKEHVKLTIAYAYELSLATEVNQK